MEKIITWFHGLSCEDPRFSRPFIPLSVDENAISNSLTYSKWPIYHPHGWVDPNLKLRDRKNLSVFFKIIFNQLFLVIFNLSLFSPLLGKSVRRGGGGGAQFGRWMNFYTYLFVVIAHHTRILMSYERLQKNNVLVTWKAKMKVFLSHERQERNMSSPWNCNMCIWRQC